VGGALAVADATSARRNGEKIGNMVAFSATEADVRF
jgi:hypothetical protein